MPNPTNARVLGGAAQPVYVIGSESGALAGDSATDPIEVTGAITGAVTVDGIAVPATTPVVGQAVIAVTGTAVRLIAASTPLPGGSVFLTALPTNTVAMTVGGSGVTNGIGGAGNGLILNAGSNAVVFIDDANKVYVNGTAGCIVSWSAG
jgi:hypothetical protein